MADAAVAERISAIWERSRRSYGAPRINAMLVREGIRVGRKRVERLMQQLGIQGAHLHKHWKTTRQDKRTTAAPDLVERNFTAVEPNTLWVADLTYIKPGKESCIWRWRWMCSLARWWVGRWPTGRPPTWCYRPSKWDCGVATPSATG